MVKRNWNPETLVQHLVSFLVGQDTQVKVWTSGTSSKCVVHVCIDPSEVNKLVGEGGKTAQAIHTLLNVMGKKRKQLIALKMESSQTASPPTKKGKVQGKKEAEQANQIISFVQSGNKHVT